MFYTTVFYSKHLYRHCKNELLNVLFEKHVCLFEVEFVYLINRQHVLVQSTNVPFHQQYKHIVTPWKSEIYISIYIYIDIHKHIYDVVFINADTTNGVAVSHSWWAPFQLASLMKHYRSGKYH